MTTNIEHLEKMTEQVEKMVALAKANCEANDSLKKFYDRLREDYDTEVEARREVEAVLVVLRDAARAFLGPAPLEHECCDTCDSIGNSTHEEACERARLAAAITAVPADSLKEYAARIRSAALLEAAAAVEGHAGEFNGYKAHEARQRAADLLRRMAAGVEK